ncbi:Hsp20/alpha crystallin family protein [Candidatus Dependentiae bacterium]|nr:Hsp20/alpha crystallin family protein [Candidatus Dependentiae bacterium]
MYQESILISSISPLKIKYFVFPAHEETESEVEDKDYYRKEIRSGSFERTIPLPTTVQSEKTMATYGNGVLKIALPKKSLEAKKQVKITVK